MNEPLNTLLNLFFRWAHVVAGIMWIGLLYFFNWVNGPFQGKIDGPTKKVVNPELLPRALFWFRWGAAWTWITGFVLAGIVYYQARQILFEQGYQNSNPWLWLAITLVAWAVGFVIYNAIMKSLANKVIAAAICLVLYAGQPQGDRIVSYGPFIGDSKEDIARLYTEYRYWLVGIATVVVVGWSLVGAWLTYLSMQNPKNLPNLAAVLTALWLLFLPFAMTFVSRRFRLLDHEPGLLRGEPRGEGGRDDAGGGRPADLPRP